METSIKEFSPIYNSEAESLKKALKSGNVEKNIIAFQNFSKKFTVIPALFEAIIQWPFDVQKISKIKDIAYLHLVNEFWIGEYDKDKILTKVVNQPRKNISFFFYASLNCCMSKVERCKEYFRLPLSTLPDYYEYFQRYSASPLSKELEEKYQQSLQLYQKIKDSESSNIEWLKLIKEVNDIKFIIQSIECRIGGCPENKEMWKLYITFLKDSKLIDLMCHTYSRYCCLFTDDLEIREEFKNEIQNLDDSFSQWKLEMVKIEKNLGTLENAISLYQKYFPSFKNEITDENFEIQFQKIWEESRKERVNPLLGYICDELSRTSITNRSKRLKLKFRNDAIHQTFSLPTTAINFMLKNAKYDHLKKLYETSKYFYSRLRSPLCYKIMIGVSNIVNKTITFQQSLYSLDSMLRSFKKCHVKEMIHMELTHLSVISSIIQTKIYKCEISTLSLLHQEIYFEDFLKLVSNVKNLKAHNSYVLNGESQKISIPEIIAKMPSVRIAKFTHLSEYSSFPSNSKVPKMKRTLEHFECKSFGVLNDPEIMWEFLNASLTSNATVLIWCRFDRDEKMCIPDMLASWKGVESFEHNVKIGVNGKTYLFP